MPEQALETADTAVLIEPDNSMAHAVRALALDWIGEYEEATNAAVRAIQLDANNSLAHAYYSEILADTQRWAQSGDEAQLALSLNPNRWFYQIGGWFFSQFFKLTIKSAFLTFLH